ncbi:MAG: YqjF family protein [Gemmatimonadales bacterium]
MDLPSYPFLNAQWRNLVMVNYEVEPALLVDRVPAGTTLDFWHGKTYVSLVGFQFREAKVLGAPVPFHQDFEEVNLRFYVRRVVAEEVRSAVVFIREVVPRQLVGGMARLLYREPYVVVPMASEVTGAPPGPPLVRYAWHLDGRWQSVGGRADGAGAPPAPRTHEEFIAIRHWGYNGKPGSDTLEYRVEHPRWTVWAARDVRVEADLTALCGLELARHLTTPATALIADGSTVTVHWRTRVS